MPWDICDTYIPRSPEIKRHAMTKHHKDEMQLGQPSDCLIAQARNERGGRSKLKGEITPESTLLVAIKVLTAWLKTRINGAGNKAVPKQHCEQVLHLWLTLLATSALDTWWSKDLVWSWCWSAVWWCEWSAVFWMTVETEPLPWQNIWLAAAIPCKGIARAIRHISKQFKIFTNVSLTRIQIF